MNHINRSLTTLLCAGIFSLGLVLTVDAALESRPGGVAYYDTHRNITWLADANAYVGEASG
ncbi:MAG: hypothetical protein K2Q13_11700 [Nitrosomonas sp.]|uniref:hypothetical protein n=1 Tax=Nitrosomonas sp. TaxID=42353 RepID=UPI0025D0AAF0|nr:hypothetical protein [Nitrosomonas sp.]MBY0475708.1 hypothetical protein [Nitrosomonas sp.]